METLVFNKVICWTRRFVFSNRKRFGILPIYIGKVAQNRTVKKVWKRILSGYQCCLRQAEKLNPKTKLK